MDQVRLRARALIHPLARVVWAFVAVGKVELVRLPTYWAVLDVDWRSDPLFFR